ncbi:hypothetical protein AMATHDRAFT_74800 [Amanita thiersii Skay4041]|uniref:DUF427 domain-containing protein n=1 Tax=Amanita thiersii Skay4041 TaxID=703135 RepID=A0A2A9NNC7_9AGAR|nr:hypothetical protein AMATHDRAFT_74800 [Amanita thiersii Skay4041]
MSLFFTIPHIEPSPRRVRVYFGGECLVDTKSAKFVWESKYYPKYFFTEQDLPRGNLKAVEESEDKIIYDVNAGGKTAARAATLHRSGDLKGLFVIQHSAMDHWFEEDEEAFGHPKDPYKRVDVLQSSRHVRIEVNGQELANTRSPRFLYETMLPMRTYIPKLDCRLDLLEESQLTTHCPYKGTANYYHVKLPSTEKLENIVWWYKSPLPECGTIKGYLSFYDEKVDVFIDGEKQPKPVWD